LKILSGGFIGSVFHSCPADLLLCHGM